MNVDIKAKVETIKESAKRQLTDKADYYIEVPKYLENVKAIKEKNRQHNNFKSKHLFQQFKKNVEEIEKWYEQNQGEISIKEKNERLLKGYVNYAIKNARLDKIGDATVFHDAMTDSFIWQKRYIEKDRDNIEHDRIDTNRINQNVVNGFIDKECKKLTGLLLTTADRTNIRRNLNIYFKQYEPLKQKFYGDFFNTYTPNGFLDVKIENKVNIEKFVTITMPKRYPTINALLENIAPDTTERIYLLNWLSTILNTAKKTKTAPVLKGIQRTGKGVFATKIIEYAMHESNCFIATNSNLADTFNGYLEDKLFITFDEVKGDFNSKVNIRDIIKGIVSEDKYQIRTMHTNPYMVTLWCNCIFLSNDDIPIPMDQSDGRFTIIETKSRKLEDVAEKDFKKTITEFIELIEKERDYFLIHLKMCEYDKKLAMRTIENTSKKIIQDATSTHEAVLKTAFRHQDKESVVDLLEEATQDILNDTLIKKEVEVIIVDNFETPKIKKQIPFEHNNKIMKEIFIKEFEKGFISNTSLKWFSKVVGLEHIFKNDKKFGGFWNKVLTGAETITLKYNEPLKNGEIKLKEKFRRLKPHEKLTIISYNNKDFVFTSSKTAEQL